LKKSDRIAEFVAGLTPGDDPSIDPCLAGYLECFNSGRYYEAHDVLEHLWLRQGREHPDHAFHKGLIQLAGAFVHLRLQYLHPDHPKHGRRVAPARRLLLLAEANLLRYPDDHLGLDVVSVRALAQGTGDSIVGGNGVRNPWHPDARPSIG
jgi:hypothetical protein